MCQRWQHAVQPEVALVNTEAHSSLKLVEAAWPHMLDVTKDQHTMFVSMMHRYCDQFSSGQAC